MDLVLGSDPTEKERKNNNNNNKKALSKIKGFQGLLEALTSTPEVITTAGAVHDFRFVFDEAVSFNLTAVKLVLVD